jgi:hypothetical protein
VTSNAISRFPSDKHYEELKKKGFDGRALNTDDMYAWHAYDYGWRRIMLQTREDNSPIDPSKRWYDQAMAAECERFYSRKFYRRPPPLVSEERQQRRPRPPEELAYVENCIRQIRANLSTFAERNRAAMEASKAGELEDERDALRRVREELGVAATEVTANAADDNGDGDNNGGFR